MDVFQVLSSFGPIIPFVFIGVAVIGVVLHFVQKKRRQEQLRGIAKRLGLKLDPEGDQRILAHFSSFGIFSRGSFSGKRRVSNLLYGGGEIAAFDYLYTVRRTNSDGHASYRRVRKTVVCCESPALNLPRFVLKPEGRIGNWFRDVFGGVDVDFDSHPVFSKKYHLSGENPEAIHGAFSSEALSYLEQRPGLCVEGSGRQLVVYKARGNPGSRLESFILEASQIAALLKRRKG